MSRGSLPTEACERRTLLDPQDLQRTIARLCSQVLESAGDSRRLLLLGIPTRGAALARVLAAELERELGHAVDQGVLDPTFHRDDLERVGTRLAEPTALPVPVEQWREGRDRMPDHPDEIQLIRIRSKNLCRSRRSKPRSGFEPRTARRSVHR